MNLWKPWQKSWICPKAYEGIPGFIGSRLRLAERPESSRQSQYTGLKNSVEKSVPICKIDSCEVGRTSSTSSHSLAMKPRNSGKKLFNAPSIIVPILLVLSLALPARGEVKITVERNPEGLPGFKFKTLPSPLRNDVAAQARFKLVEGQGDANGGRLRALNDGLLPEGEDEPAENFFFQAGTEGGRLQLDLGHVIAIKQVNSYSWHSADRAPQVYTLYAADGAASGFEAMPKKEINLEQCGWKRLANVDTRLSYGAAGGQYGVSVADAAGALGSYRYLLFDISPTETKYPFGNTFFSEIDVRAMEPAEPEVEAGARLVAIKDFNYTLDVSQAPDLKDWAETTLRPEIDKWYPIIRECLASDGFTAPKQFNVIIKPMRGVAATGGTEVNVSEQWIHLQLKRPEWNEAVGSVIHELVHVVQQYHTRGNPGWLVEGVADYLRWFHFEPLAHRPTLRNPARAKYTDSYKTTAGFLEFVVKNHDHEMAVKLNAAMRQGLYSPEVWKESTGLTIQQLWSEYVAACTSNTNSTPLSPSGSDNGRQIPQ